jgi:small subunit ribosomal protein S2
MAVFIEKAPASCRVYHRGAMSGNLYDVFLCHSSRDKPAVEVIARQLKRAGLRPWLDKWNLIPGEPFQIEIERALSSCQACAVFVGAEQGPWQNEEMRAAISRRVRNANFRVIPVLLPHVKSTILEEMPPFLAAATSVVFRNSLNDREALHLLISGVRGLMPGDGPDMQEVEIHSERWIFVVSAEFDQVNKEVAETILEHLRTMSGNMNLTIKKIAAGSVIFVLEGTPAGYEEIASRFKAGKLTSVLGFEVLDICRELTLESPGTTFSISVSELLEARIQYGRRTKHPNLAMRKYISGERPNGSWIFDLEKTLRMLSAALRVLTTATAQGKIILFVGNKREAQESIEFEAKRCGMFYVNQRWLGGLLTNWVVVQKAVKRLNELDDMATDAAYKLLNHGEIAKVERERRHLQASLAGIKTMRRLPDVLFVVDSKYEAMAVNEARKLGISVVGTADSDCDPTVLDWVIPANCHTAHAIRLIVSKVASGIIEGISRANVGFREEDYGGLPKDQLQLPKDKPPQSSPKSFDSGWSKGSEEEFAASSSPFTVESFVREAERIQKSD